MSIVLFSGLAAILLIGCAKTDIAKDPASDPSCIAYFDGCNTCRKGPEEGMAACTKKYCAPEAMEEPRCLETKG